MLEHAWRKAGWGPRLASPIPGHQPPLLVSLRWPAGWERSELTGSAGTPASVKSPLAACAPWDREAASVTTQRLTLRLPRGGGGEMRVVVTLSVSLADVGEAPDPEEAAHDAEPIPSGSFERLRTRSRHAVALGEGAPSVEVLVVRYMLATPFGVLALVFSAVQRAFYDVLEPLFADVAQTVRLDPWQPAQE